MMIIKGNDIYTTNTVNEALVDVVKQLLEDTDEVEVNFDVSGRTCHQLLSYQLYEQLDQNKYGAKIGYNYECKIYKKQCLTIVTLEIQYKDIMDKPLVCYLKRAFSTQKKAEAFLKQVNLAELNLQHLLGDLYTKGDQCMTLGEITIETVPLD